MDGESKCPVCRATFTPKRRSSGGLTGFCSITCANKSRSKVEVREISCDRCGSVFSAKPDHGVWPKFCSRKCFCASAHFGSCSHCGKRYRKKSGAVETHKFCSRTCQRRSNIKGRTRACENCKCEFVDYTTKRNTRHCSVACRNMAMVGPSSPAWRGGWYQDNTGRVVINTSSSRCSYVREHRLVAARIIGRPLRRTEICLHIDGNTRNNDPSNLFLYSTISEWKTSAANGLHPSESNLVPLTYVGTDTQ
jgi:hypothetical protein